MKQYIQQLKRPKILFGALSLLMLPIVIGGVYVANQLQPRAQSCVPALNAQATRVSNVAAEITFQTATAVKATVQCTIERDGVMFFAGEDAEATTQHVINTQEFNVNLNPNTGYYCYIQTCPDSPVEVYVPASATISTFGLDASAYTDDLYGSCEGDDLYDPAYDINQDGCILLNDLNEFPDF